MDLRQLDLNLLVVLKQLLLQRHVSRAAEQLHMSQPAVSRALKRLRECLGDPLLVHTSQGYVLSARGQVLLPQLNQLLQGIEQMVQGPEFDPASSRQTLRFYAPDPEIMRFLPHLFERISQLSPHMVLEAHSDPKDHFAPLESADVHFVISGLQPRAQQSQLRRMRLAKMDFALIMRAGHPLATGDISWEDYLNAQHGVISITGRGPMFLEEKLHKKGVLEKAQHLSVALRLSSFSSVASFCERSDVIFHLPRSYVQQVVKGRQLVMRESIPEIRFDAPWIYLYWHQRFHNDPMCQWVREQMRHVLKKTL